MACKGETFLCPASKFRLNSIGCALVTRESWDDPFNVFSSRNSMLRNCNLLLLFLRLVKILLLALTDYIGCFRGPKLGVSYQPL